MCFHGLDSFPPGRVSVLMPGNIIYSSGSPPGQECALTYPCNSTGAKKGGKRREGGGTLCSFYYHNTITYFLENRPMKVRGQLSADRRLWRSGAIGTCLARRPRVSGEGGPSTNSPWVGAGDRYLYLPDTRTEIYRFSVHWRGRGPKPATQRYMLLKIHDTQLRGN